MSLFPRRLPPDLSDPESEPESDPESEPEPDDDDDDDEEELEDEADRFDFWVVDLSRLSALAARMEAAVPVLRSNNMISNDGVTERQGLGTNLEGRGSSRAGIMLAVSFVLSFGFLSIAVRVGRALYCLA